MVHPADSVVCFNVRIYMCAVHESIHVVNVCLMCTHHFWPTNSVKATNHLHAASAEDSDHVYGTVYDKASDAGQT